MRQRLFVRILGEIPAKALAKGLTKKSAADTAWTIASPESYDLLVHRLGYSLDELRAWVARTLLAALLDKVAANSRLGK